MKKIIFAISFAFLFYATSWSQCMPAIPANANVVDSTQTVNGGFTPQWVCAGDTLISGGGIFNVYLEPGAVMTTGGGIDTIFVKKGAKFFMNGGIHYIYYEDNNDLNLAGGIPTTDSCPAIIFDYFNAPANGCFTGPLAAFTAKDTLLCAGDCIDFTNQSINATTCEWIFTGGNPATSTVFNPLNICYDTAGIYDVTLIVTNGSDTDTLVMPGLVHVNPLPAVTVTQNLNILTATAGYASYQWYFGNIILNGATSNTLTAFQNATYFVHVYDTNGCKSIVPFVYASQGINDMSTESPFIISPNPAKEDITVQCKPELISNQNQNFEINIYDAFGKTVSSEDIKMNPLTEVSVRELAAGIYFVKLATANKVFVSKLIVE